MRRLRSRLFVLGLLPYLLFLVASSGLHNHGVTVDYGCVSPAAAGHSPAHLSLAEASKSASRAETCPACAWMTHSTACQVAPQQVVGVGEVGPALLDFAPAGFLATTPQFRSRAPPA